MYQDYLLVQKNDVRHLTFFKKILTCLKIKPHLPNTLVWHKHISLAVALTGVRSLSASCDSNRITAIFSVLFNKFGEIQYTVSLCNFVWHFGFLVNEQRDAQIPFYVFIFIFNSLHVSSTSCSSSGETNCVNKTSGNCHSVLVAVSCARHGHQHRVTVTRGCIDTICLSWWWARRARNM